MVKGLKKTFVGWVWGEGWGGGGLCRKERKAASKIFLSLCYSLNHKIYAWRCKLMLVLHARTHGHKHTPWALFFFFFLDAVKGWELQSLIYQTTALTKAKRVKGLKRSGGFLNFLIYFTSQIHFLVILIMRANWLGQTKPDQRPESLLLFFFFFLL